MFEDDFKKQVGYRCQFEGTIVDIINQQRSFRIVLLVALFIVACCIVHRLPNFTKFMKQPENNTFVRDLIAVTDKLVFTDSTRTIKTLRFVSRKKTCLTSSYLRQNLRYVLALKR